MSITPERLVGYLRAEYARSSKWRTASFFIGILVSVPAVASILVDEPSQLYLLAILNFAALTIWLSVNYWHQNIQGAAHSARRAALILNGLGDGFSPVISRQLRENFTVSETRAIEFEHDGYYSSTLPHGPKRLAELLEESAYFSSRLHQISANIMLVVMVLFVAIFCVIALASVPTASNEIAMIGVQIFLAATLFILSSDVLGAWIAHKRCARSTAEVSRLIEVVGNDDISAADVLLILEGYTSAIESAPEIVPFVYRVCGSSISTRWGEYMADKQSAEAAN